MRRELRVFINIENNSTTKEQVNNINTNTNQIIVTMATVIIALQLKLFHNVINLISAEGKKLY